MKTDHRITPGALLFLFVLLICCRTEPNKKTAGAEMDKSPKEAGFKVLTSSMEFQCVDTIAAGWNKIIYENQSTEPHFILLDKYPEGRSITDTKKDIIPRFDEGMALIMEGKNEEAMEAFAKLPEWFSEIVFSGGTGLISPKNTAITYVNFKPGYYIMECYIKMPDGKFHTSMGMTKELWVVETENNNQPPESDIQIELSSENGIEYEGSMSVGKNVFTVTYKDQIVHENFVGHDLSLVHLESGADLQSLENWMNWATPDGLMSSTLPPGITFIGGTNDAPAGSVHYFEAELKPGNYAFVSEVPNAKAKGMLQTFSVSQ